MNNTRRNFLKYLGLTGLGTATIGIAGANSLGREERKYFRNLEQLLQEPHEQVFNMCGYAAPKLDVVRIGSIGLGERGSEHIRILSKIGGIEIRGLCDIRPEFANRSKEVAVKYGHKPEIYTGSSNAWKKMCERDDIDVIFIQAPWDMHTPMALYAMEHGKHVCVEVPAAVTLEECWQLVETSERTRKHCRMLENACFAYLTTLNMAREGFFGKVVHGQGGYVHNLVFHYLFNKNQYWQMWRLRENAARNGDLYPTHGLGPICQIMNINRGNKLDYMVSLSSNDFTLGPKAKELAAQDEFFEPYAYANFRGNMNVSLIRTHEGQTITLDHDVSSPNIHDGWQKIVGTKGTSVSCSWAHKLSNGGEKWLTDQEVAAIEAEYEPELLKRIDKMAKEIGGHGGIDTMEDWFLIDNFRNGLPMDQDVYDAALWSSIGPLSELSVVNRSSAVDIPDFTCGSWKTNPAFDISLQRGGNTTIKA